MYHKTNDMHTAYSCLKEGLSCLFFYKKSGELLPRLFTIVVLETKTSLYIFCDTFPHILRYGRLLTVPWFFKV